MTPLPRRWGGLLLAVVLACVAILAAPSAHATAPVRLPAIVGGGPLAITSSPWDVALVQKGTLCSGSLIAPTWIITAAHCVDNMQPADIAAFLGISQLSQRGPANQAEIVGIVLHPQWDAAIYANDLALLQLRTPVTTSASVQPIALPDSADPAAWPAKGQTAAISGWGDMSGTGRAADQLQGATIHVLAGPGEALCGQYGSSFVPTRSICAGEPAGGVDTCQGDSGSALAIPLAGTTLLAGVTSAGEGCAEAAYPGIYTRVTSYLPWIRQYVPAVTPPAVAGVQPLSSARAVVSWTPLPVAPTGGYTATVAPGGQTCTVPDGASCVVTGLTAGATYTATVTGGGATVGTTPQFTAISGSGTAGVSVPTRRVVAWSGLPASSGARVVVAKGSGAICRITSGRLVLRAPGMCLVKVTSAGRQARAVIAVSA